MNTHLCTYFLSQPISQWRTLVHPINTPHFTATPTWKDICGPHMCETHTCCERDVFVIPFQKIIFPNSDITQIKINTNILCLSYHCFLFSNCRFFEIIYDFDIKWLMFFRDFCKGKLGFNNFFKNHNLCFILTKFLDKITFQSWNFIF